MKNKISKFIIASALLSIIFTPSAYAVTSASFGVSQSTQSVVVNDTFSISVYENGDNVNVVTVKLAFDSTKLQLKSASCSATLPNNVSETNGITCYGNTAISGNNMISTFSFKALAGNGSASISVIDGSKIVTEGSNIWDKVVTYAVINLIEPAPAATPTPTPAPSNTSVDSSKTKSSNMAQNQTQPIATQQPNGSDSAADSAKVEDAENSIVPSDAVDNNGQTLGVVDEKADDIVANDGYLPIIVIVLLVMTAAAITGIYLINTSKKKKNSKSSTYKKVQKSHNNN